MTVYVLEGTFTLALDGREPVSIQAGQVFVEPAGIHMTGYNVILMRPHNWAKFSFGTWLKNAALRMHRNKLATALANKLARIAWSVLRNEKAVDTHGTDR